jgi:hypothetical protein
MFCGKSAHSLTIMALPRPCTLSLVSPLHPLQIVNENWSTLLPIFYYKKWHISIIYWWCWSDRLRRLFPIITTNIIIAVLFIFLSFFTQYWITLFLYFMSYILIYAHFQLEVRETLWAHCIGLRLSVSHFFYSTFLASTFVSTSLVIQ